MIGRLEWRAGFRRIFRTRRSGRREVFPVLRCGRNRVGGGHLVLRYVDSNEARYGGKSCVVKRLGNFDCEICSVQILGGVRIEIGTDRTAGSCRSGDGTRSIRRVQEGAMEGKKMVRLCRG
jgi:hypothetical protein